MILFLYWESKKISQMPKSKKHGKFSKKNQGFPIIIVHNKPGEVPDMVMNREERRKIKRKERGSTS